MSGILVRQASAEDAEAMLAIYAWYVKNTAVTFEYDVPAPEEFRQRIGQGTKRYPWLAAEEDGRILGYAYAAPFKGRTAYDWSVETTIYMDPGARRRGVGSLLYRALERELDRLFGAGSAPYAVAIAVRDHRGVTADELVVITGLPIASVLEGIGLLEVSGIITTDLRRRCALAPAWA